MLPPDRAATLDALVGQTQQPTRIVVVVNNSTDASLAVAYSRADRYRWQVKIDVLEMAINNGKKAGALNHGLSHLRGQSSSRTLAKWFDYIVTMDGDTELEPDFLARATVILDDNERLGGQPAWWPVVAPVLLAARGTLVRPAPRPAVLTLGERLGQVWDREEQRGDRLSEESGPSPQRRETDLGNDAGAGITSESWRNRSQPRPRLP